MDKSAEAIDDDVQAAYLRRLGLDAEPPSVEALQRLHTRQVERVPYETMWIHAGEAWGISRRDAVARVALEGRGGYCYHLNGAFSLLLGSLGYAVTRHVGGVHGPDGPSDDSTGNHLVLSVAGLPSSENPSGIWYVDAGLGDALHEALPLVAGEYDEGPFRLVLDEADDAPGSWHLTHDPTGGFAGMSWSMAGAEMHEFAVKHEWLSTSPDSGFVQVAMAERRDATGVDVIRGLVLSRVGSDAWTDEPLTDRTEWFEMLADLFGLGFDHTPPEALDHLWTRTLEKHRAWEALS